MVVLLLSPFIVISAFDRDKMVDVGSIAKLETSGPVVATVADPDENI